MTELRVEIERQDDMTLVRVAGEIDLATADDLKASVGGLSGHVVLDFAAVRFLDSSGIGTLVACRKRLRTAGGDLHIRRAHDIPKRALELTGLADLLES